MTESGEPLDALLDAWRSLAAQGAASAGGRAGAAAASAAAPAGLQALAEAYLGFGQELWATLAGARGTDGADLEVRLRSLGERFATRVLAPLGVTAFAPPAATGSPAAGASADPLDLPALGLGREQQLRLQALARATRDCAVAAQEWLLVLAGVGRDAGARHAERLRRDGWPATLRAAFDAWIEDAERAWQAAAHGEAWCRAQARLFDAQIVLRGLQQQQLALAARGLDLPTRAELDAVHRTLHERWRAGAPPLAATRDAAGDAVANRGGANRDDANREGAARDGADIGRADRAGVNGEAANRGGRQRRASARRRPRS